MSSPTRGVAPALAVRGRPLHDDDLNETTCSMSSATVSRNSDVAKSRRGGHRRQGPPGGAVGTRRTRLAAVAGHRLTGHLHQHQPVGRRSPRTFRLGGGPAHVNLAAYWSTATPTARLPSLWPPTELHASGFARPWPRPALRRWSTLVRSATAVQPAGFHSVVSSFGATGAEVWRALTGHQQRRPTNRHGHQSSAMPKRSRTSIGYSPTMWP